MNKGRVILLNGTSSSGKSSLARALQSLLSTPDAPYFHIEGDQLRSMHPTHTPTQTAGMPRFFEAIPPSLATLAAYGNNLIIDDTFGEGQVQYYSRAFADFDALFVGVRCTIDVLIARETTRGDRNPGTAAELDSHCHKHGLYDMEVDTSQMTTSEAAQTIKSHWEHGPTPNALRRLAEQGSLYGAP